MVFVRPADANETAEAWKFAINYKKGPVALALTRQKLPVIDAKKYAGAEGLQKGAYILAESGKPDAIIIATGSEVSVAMAAYEQLVAGGKKLRLVSMPCWEVFDKQDEKYRESVLPSSVSKRVSIEAGITKGWSRYVGDKGISIGIDKFGASAPGPIVMKEYGITSDAVVAAVEKLLK